jgi:hypothetical protein
MHRITMQKDEALKILIGSLDNLVLSTPLRLEANRRLSTVAPYLPLLWLIPFSASAFPLVQYRSFSAAPLPLVSAPRVVRWQG